jgi:hypothetical protein
VLFGVGARFIQDGTTTAVGVLRLYLLMFASIDAASQVSIDQLLCAVA